MGIRRNPEKGKFLIPPCAPDPLPPGPDEPQITLNTTRTGIIIAGTPVGSGTSAVEHAKARFKLAVQRHDSIRRVGKHDPQAAFMLLSSAGIHALDFMMNTTKPGLIQDILSDFDDLIDHTRLTLLLDEDTRTACTQSPLRLKLAGHIAALQLKSGGLGHTRAVRYRALS